MLDFLYVIKGLLKRSKHIPPTCLLSKLIRFILYSLISIFLYNLNIWDLMYKFCVYINIQFSQMYSTYLDPRFMNYYLQVSAVLDFLCVISRLLNKYPTYVRYPTYVIRDRPIGTESHKSPIDGATRRSNILNHGANLLVIVKPCGN